MSAFVVRPVGPDEVDLFTSFADASPLGLKPPLAMYLDGLHTWYRPAWSWVALRDGQVVARVAFGGPPEAELPLAMGSLEIGTRSDRVECGLALVRTAYAAMTGGGSGEGGRPEYRQFLPVDWHEHAGMRAAVADRRTVARLAGPRFLVERVELRCSRSCAAPWTAPGRPRQTRPRQGWCRGGGPRHRRRAAGAAVARAAGLRPRREARGDRGAWPAAVGS